MLCFREFPVGKKFMDKGGGGHNFPSKTFCLTVPKIFVGESFSVSLMRVSKNFKLQRVMSQFFVEFFSLTVPKNFVEEPFCAVFQKISGSEKVCG